MSLVDPLPPSLHSHHHQQHSVPSDLLMHRQHSSSSQQSSQQSSQHSQQQQPHHSHPHHLSHRTSSRRPSHWHPPPPPSHLHAVNFLSSIPLSVDPGQPPPPLFPFMNFQDAVRAWLAAGGGDESQWAEAKMRSCVEFLGNITLGTETAEQRPQPVLHLPMTYFQQHQQQHPQQNQQQQYSPQQNIAPSMSRQSSAHAQQGGDGSPHDNNASSATIPLSAPALVHASSLRAIASARQASGDGDLLLFPSIPPSSTPPLPSTAGGILPLRLHTPPLSHPNSASPTGAQGQMSVGAQLFQNALMFPSTLELTRATTAHPSSGSTVTTSNVISPHNLMIQQQQATFHLPPGLNLGRATTEYPSSGPITPRAPFSSPQLSQQNSLEVNQASGDERMQSVSATMDPSSLQQQQQQHLTNTMPSPSENSRTLRPGDTTPIPLVIPQQHATQQTTQPQQLSPPGQVVRADGTGQGLRDQDALFVSLPQSEDGYEEWEAGLLQKGITDARTRLVFASSSVQMNVPNSAKGSGKKFSPSPMMVSSLIPYVAREHSHSNASSEVHTPAQKSRAGSFSDAPPSLSLGPQGVSASLQRAAGAKNALLGMALAAAAAHERHESEGYDGSTGLFGKRKGMSYGYLLPHSLAGKKAASAAVAALATSATSSTDLVPSAVGGGASSSASSSLLDPSAAAALHPSLVDSNDAYDPYFLDDPNIKSGKHRVVLNLQGFISSLISYVNQKDLKNELNDTFEKRHESWLRTGSGMSLSKIRKCKQLLLDIGQSLNLEISTISISYIYFEKLILSCYVEKENRKLIAGVCLLLAYKWTESRAGEVNKKSLALLLAECERVLGCNKNLILKQEFPVYVQLGFNLMVKTEHVLHHFRQCLSKLDTVPQDYLHIEWSL